MIKGYQTEVLLGSYMKGDPNTGIHYYLLSVMGMNGKRYHCIVRNYGKNADGTPWEDVTIVGEDDGTCESYNYAYKIFRMLVD